MEPGPEAADAARRPLGDDVRTLASDAARYARAEFELQKARATFVVSRVKSIAILGVAAVLLVFFALMALTVGAVLSLATLIGPLGATLVVAVVLAIGALVCARLASRQWGRMAEALAGRNVT